jgi:hypothetical protein
VLLCEAVPTVQSQAAPQLQQCRSTLQQKKDVIMKSFTLPSIKATAVFVSVAMNALLFLALGVGFDRAAEPGLTVVQLPAVTVYGKRMVTEPASVAFAKTQMAVTLNNDIKL